LDYDAATSWALPPRHRLRALIVLSLERLLVSVLGVAAAVVRLSGGSLILVGYLIWVAAHVSDSLSLASFIAYGTLWHRDRPIYQKYSQTLT